jgi:hypothetical protein
LAEAASGFFWNPQLELPFTAFPQTYTGQSSLYAGIKRGSTKSQQGQKIRRQIKDTD